ncbi:MAG: hypothetical protein WCK39_00055 [Methanomassiliicoccales archaeon]
MLGSLLRAFSPSYGHTKGDLGVSFFIATLALMVAACALLTFFRII